jgi:hypothetical protein
MVKKKLNRAERERSKAVSRLLSIPMEAVMADEKRDDDAIEVIEPLPTGETEEEHDRIRRSNDIDQRLEREGVVSKHNRGYDEAAHRAGTRSKKG